MHARCFAGPDLAGGRPGAPGGRPGPSGLFGISERDWLSNYRVLKIEGFGGRPRVGGRPCCFVVVMQLLSGNVAQRNTGCY